MSRPEKTDRVVVYGNGVFAELMWFHLTHDSPYEVVGFTVDKPYIVTDHLFDLPVVPFAEVEVAFPPARNAMLVSLSFQRLNRLREDKYNQARSKGYRLISYISSRAVTYPGLRTGDNCVILESAVIAPFVSIGSDVIIASGAIIGHHSAVRNHVFISPGAVILGGATIGQYSLIGANASVKEEVIVSQECLIGSGVSVARDTLERGVYVNPPAQLQPRRSDQLRTWLMWPVRTRSSADGSAPVPEREVDE